jgi:hypothetical protein
VAIRFIDREGIERQAESLLITAFLNNRKPSYPRCYPQLILRKSATEPWTLGQIPGGVLVGYFQSPVSI